MDNTVVWSFAMPQDKLKINPLVSKSIGFSLQPHVSCISEVPPPSREELNIFVENNLKPASAPPI